MKFLKAFFYLFFLGIQFLAAQTASDFYISNKGNDVNDGRSALQAKKTIKNASLQFSSFYNTNKSLKIGLNSGDLFNETLIASYPVNISTFSTVPDNDFAIMNGSMSYDTGWTKVPGTSHTYMHLVYYHGFNSNGINGITNYNFLSAFEVNKQTELSSPYSSRKVLEYVNSIEKVESNPSSYYVPYNSPAYPIPVYVHLDNGSSPAGNQNFRCEITVRDWAVNSYNYPGSHFENLWIRGFGAGNGMLAGGLNSSYNKVVFGPGAGIHHLVLHSGVINHSLFLPGAKNTGEFAVVFYNEDGLQQHCTIKNSMFLDVPSVLYAHTANTNTVRNYSAIEMNGITAFTEKDNSNSFMYTSNTDSVILNKIYADGYYSGYQYGNARYALISHSCFTNISGFGIAYNNQYNPITATVNDVFIKTKGETNMSGIIIQPTTDLQVTNSIIHLSSQNNNPNYSAVGSFTQGTGGNQNKIVARQNIFICDVDSSKSVFGANTNTDKGRGTSTDRWDNNVYIMLKGKDIYWTVTNPSTFNGKRYIFTFEEWQQQSGQDQHSLYFDLRKDPRGLKAIFVDPDKGNYELANTKEGKQILAMGAGMTDPINCFLTKPTYEKAAEMIRKESILSSDQCRNPCRQYSIKDQINFTVSDVSTRQVKLSWKCVNTNNIDHFEIQRAGMFYGFNSFLSVPVAADSVYSFTDEIVPGVDYQYRLVVIPVNNGICYSGIDTIKTTDTRNVAIYPNPSNGKLNIAVNNFTGKVHLQVVNAVGDPVFDKDEFVNEVPVQINITHLPKGLYFLRFSNSKTTTFQKFILN